jgi:hypothetical protein
MDKSGQEIIISLEISLEHGGGDNASYDKLRACKQT